MARNVRHHGAIENQLRKWPFGALTRSVESPELAISEIEMKKKSIISKLFLVIYLHLLSMDRAKSHATKHRGRLEGP